MANSIINRLSRFGRLLTSRGDQAEHAPETVAKRSDPAKTWWAFAIDAATEWTSGMGTAPAMLPVHERLSRVDMTRVIAQLEEILRRVRDELKKRNVSPVDREQLNITAGRVRRQLARAKLTLIALTEEETLAELNESLSMPGLNAETRADLWMRREEARRSLHRATAELRIFDISCEIEDLSAREQGGSVVAGKNPSMTAAQREERLELCKALLSQAQADRDKGPPPLRDDLSPAPRSASTEDSDELRNDLAAKLNRQRVGFGNPFER